MFTNLRSYPHTMGRGAKLALPDGWLVAPLRRLVDVRGGMTPSMARREFWDGGVPWVTPKDMKRPLISDSIDHISTTAIRETSLSLVPASAVLMVVRGMILARHVPIARTLRPATINQDMKALVARPGLLPEFLHYVLIGENLRLLALVSESGHGTRKLETALWREVELALPPADEQAAIVKYLAHAHARIDRAIAAKRKLIALLDEQKQAIIGRAVTRGLDPTAPLKESCIPWLGQVP
ncbi:MAG: restriction endonuclease subunit S, partial [Cellulomonadaceae bacterium]|nr:restriction endonuclease subunit S [Cellulomonadaceae bacterium]